MKRKIFDRHGKEICEGDTIRILGFRSNFSVENRDGALWAISNENTKAVMKIIQWGVKLPLPSSVIEVVAEAIKKNGD